MFVGAAKHVSRGFGSTIRHDYRLTRYACYLVAMNGDPRKPVRDYVCAGQSHFTGAAQMVKLDSGTTREIRDYCPDHSYDCDVCGVAIASSGFMRHEPCKPCIAELRKWEDYVRPRITEYTERVNREAVDLMGDIPPRFRSYVTPRYIPDIAMDAIFNEREELNSVYQ